ncbi:MAG: GGDEF domain-containing protein [Propionivibrio sp.]
MMKYRETIEQSAEYLRLALPLMSRQAAALHPVSYGIWYEYVAGFNKPLRKAIDELTRDGKVLDEVMTSELFRTHIAELDEQTAHRVATGFRKVMAEVSQDAADAGEHASRFGNALEQWSEDLGNDGTAAVAESGINLLLSGTREMQGAIATLQRRLDASRAEIERLQREVNQAREAALADELTGLTNRRGFDLALAARLAEEDGQTDGTCLLLADIDHFKRVNDTYGHLVGDKVLRAVAQILKASVKGKDTAARFGGEEFVVLLPDTSIEGAQALAEKLRRTIERSRIRRSDNQQEIAQITVSFGIASHCAGESASDFVSRVDNALYLSKRLGRNRVTLASERQARSPAGGWVS